MIADLDMLTSPLLRALAAFALLAHWAEEAEWERVERTRGRLSWLRADGTRS